MNVFEDLIEELKEENLLESTVMEVDADLMDEFQRTAPPNSVSAFEEVTGEELSFTTFDNIESDAGHSEAAIPPTTDEESNDESLQTTDMPAIVKPQNQREFFRKRAMEEVSSMQMVEHVLSGVERQHMKMVPIPYDDLQAKKALHIFLQATDDLKSQECADAEYVLMQETQKWYGVLAERDANISVANIRRFCEESRPILSSQALISLARFYRNSPFSETVRGKFDFIMTRLFSRESESEKRKHLFARNEMVGHISTLYDNWSSINLFSFEEHETEFTLAAAQFEDFAAEAESADSLDSLLKQDLFERIRTFKEGLAEMFYAQEVVAAAIDCNVRLGNRFLELIDTERSLGNPAFLKQKYGNAIDSSVSDAISRTFRLLGILHDNSLEELDGTHENRNLPTTKPRKVESDPSFSFSFNAFGVNKWLLAITMLVCIISVGIYFAADRLGRGEVSNISAKEVNVANPELKQHIQIARSSSETLYAMTEPSWDAMTEDQQKEFLGMLADYAKQIGLSKVNVLNSKGRTVAFADNNRREVIGAS